MQSIVNSVLKAYLVAKLQTSNFRVSSMAHLCCAIEMEPRTLNVGQLNHAREAAVEIIQNMETDESSTAFIEGLKPVVPMKKMEEIAERRECIHSRLVDGKEAAAPARLPLYDCACTAGNVDESPDVTKLREPLSAPF